MKKTLTIFLTACTLAAHAQGPEITSWELNLDGSVGYNNIPSNIQQLQYSTNNVYVSCACIPGYDIGPWAGNPNVPANMNFVFKITRTPVQNTGTLVTTPMGHIGVFINGVSMFNARDGFSYGNQGIWNQDAIPNEGSSFDDCLGHPAPNGEYHNHLNPTCLYDDSASTIHSPIIGWAFDGFPVYGPYAFANTNGTGGIVRMQSSYRKRNITSRQTLPDGTVLTSGQYGPAINTVYPLGTYIEDYEFVNGLGTLDEHNGRFAITPDYPSGIYAYYVTLDSLNVPEYPYLIGPQYYGTVQSGNTGPGSGHNTVTETVVNYSGAEENNFSTSFSCYPNPAENTLNISVTVQGQTNATIFVTDVTGKQVLPVQIFNSSFTQIDVSQWNAGMYILHAVVNGNKTTARFSKRN